ncbi:hypothetical protein PVAP13_3KG517901 [Panicum virgatum]|uniref:Uncharacterized protein n=1 Tax=Panicum virgatum TaxID=38727 RepID=A0A8T0V6A0_PANVG|nr:hypothetical protein PVAP13_3KG517901 [Panicum virgatum]
MSSHLSPRSLSLLPHSLSHARRPSLLRPLPCSGPSPPPCTGEHPRRLLEFVAAHGPAAEGQGRRAAYPRRRSGGSVPAPPPPARGGEGGRRALVAPAVARGALRAAGCAGPAVPAPPRLRHGDGRAHGGGRRQAHVAAGLTRHAPPGARLLPLLEEDLR